MKLCLFTRLKSRVLVPFVVSFITLCNWKFLKSHCLPTMIIHFNLSKKILDYVIVYFTLQ